MRKKKNYREIYYKLKSQLDNLKIFCELWDKGNENMTQEIAVKLRVIFHQTDKSDSLISLLGLDSINYFSATSKVTPPGYLGLLTISMSTLDFKVSLVPGVHKNRKELTYNDWWDNEAIIIDFDNKIHTRKRLILDVANTDGGAHVDKSFKEDYYNLTRNHKLGYEIIGSFSGIARSNPIPPTIRRIADEVIETFASKENEIISLLSGRWDNDISM